MRRLLPVIIFIHMACHGWAFGQESSSPEQPLTRNVPIPDFQNRNEDVTPYNYDAPPAGMFYSITLAEGFEEEVGIRQSHEIVPVNEKKSFRSDQPVFIVFRVYPHFESYQVMGRCFPEQVARLDPHQPVLEDKMYLALEDDTGYLKFIPPEGGWKAGAYKVEIHVGWKVSDFSLLGVMRFSVKSTNDGTVSQDP